MKNLIKLTCALITAFTMLACRARQEPPEVEGGGMDGGGGTMIYHSREKVIETVQKVWAQFAVNRLDNPLVRAYEIVSHSEMFEQSAEWQHARKVLLKITEFEDCYAPKLPDQPEHTKIMPFMQFLAGKKINLIADGYCNSLEHRQAAASVSHLNKSGEICVSLTALMHTATSGMYADVLALMAHEVAHLYGFGEEDAHKFQRFYLDNMAMILRTDGRTAKEKYIEGVSEITSQWRILLHYDFVPRPGPAEKKLAKDLGGLYFQIPRPYSHDQIQLANPENFDSVVKKAVELSKQYDVYLKDLKARIGKDERLPVDDRALAEMRRVGLLMLEFEGEATTYVYGDGYFSWSYFEKSLFIDATEPAILIHPETRPCIIRTRLQLENTAGRSDLCRMTRKWEAEEKAKKKSVPDDND